MSREGHISAGGAAAYNVVDPTVPYATVARRERSRKLAQKRRDSYKSIMDDLISVCTIIHVHVCCHDDVHIFVVCGYVYIHVHTVYVRLSVGMSTCACL